MGLRAACDRLIAIVAAVTPRDQPLVAFRPIDYGKGANPGLEAAAQSADRLFDLDVGAPADNGEVGVPPQRQRCAITLRVRYAMKGSALNRKVRQGEDTDTLRRALHTPVDWQTPTTGIDAVLCYDAPTTTQIIPQTTDSPAHELLLVPISIIYREAT